MHKHKMIVNRHVFERRPRSTEGYRVPIARPARRKGKAHA